jgi:hypothetical protein
VAPLFFVSVASKGFTHAVSLLFATLAGIFISVAAKGLMWTKIVCTLERLNVGISGIPPPRHVFVKDCGV